jgi:phosphoribosyl 1,2-cyclic phosphodiesterase
LDPVSRTATRPARTMDDASAVTVRCWGTRGSIPSPGPTTVRYGGNTSCFEVLHQGERLIFDAGSGIRPLGMEIVEKGPNAIHIFLTHFHWDHIQGFPFFPPLYDPEDQIKVVGPKQKDIDVQNLFAGQMGPIYFPVPFNVVAATMEFQHLNEGGYQVGDAALDVIRVKHPSYVLGYRIRIAGQVICFVPDNEIEGDIYPVGQDWEQRFRSFVEGADLLIHDSMYTDEEYAGRSGWGHSTFSQALRLAEDAGVKRLLFFHHDPTRSDGELDTVVAKLRDGALARGSRLEVDAAAEGVELQLGGAHGGGR